MVGSHTHKYARNANSYHLANDDHVAQNIWGDWNNNADTGPAGGPETHPPNAYVMYFIYVGKPAQVLEPATDQEKKDPKTRTGRIKCYKDAKGACKTIL